MPTGVAHGLEIVQVDFPGDPQKRMLAIHRKGGKNQLEVEQEIKVHIYCLRK